MSSQNAGQDASSLESPEVDFKEASSTEGSAERNGPAVHEPAVSNLTVNDPAANDPAFNDPTLNEPAVNDPTVDDPAANDPIVNDPAIHAPAAPEAGTLVSDAPELEISESEFAESELSETEFSETELSESELSKSELSKSELSKSELSKSELSRSKLSKSKLPRSGIPEAGAPVIDTPEADSPEAGNERAVTPGSDASQSEPADSELLLSGAPVPENLDVDPLLLDAEGEAFSEGFELEPAEETRQKSVGEYLADGFSPGEVPGLEELSPVKLFQPLLRELLLGGPDDFWMRLFVMRELLADQETSWSQDSLAVKFGWLAEEARRDVIRRMSRGGWLAFNEGRYSVTPLGEAAISITGMLGDLASRAGDLGLVVHSLKMAKEYGLDSRTQLDQLRHKLSAIGQEMERAYDSRSEHAILEAQKRLDGYLHWVETARQVLEKYELTTPQEHDRVRSAHDLLSRLHHWVSALQRALNDIGKRRVHLGDGGLTMRDITAFLARSDEDTLVALADGVLHLPLEQRFVIGDNMLSEAEYEICVRELPDDERRGWSEAAKAESVEPELAAGGPIEDFVVDMREQISTRKTIPVSRFVSRESWATSAYRFTLLTLAGSADRQDEEEGAENAEEQGPGRLLGTLPVDVEFDHTVWERVDGEFVSEMTSGKIIPRQATAKNEADKEADSEASQESGHAEQLAGEFEEEALRSGG